MLIPSSYFQEFNLECDNFIASEKHGGACYSYEDKEISKVPNIHSLGCFENTETGFLSDTISMKGGRDCTGAICSMSTAKEYVQHIS